MQIKSMVQIVLPMEGQPIVHYHDCDMITALKMLAKGVEIMANTINEASIDSEPKRIYTPPPGFVPKGGH